MNKLLATGSEISKTLFFAKDSPEDRWSPVTKYLLILALFVITRGCVAASFHERGMEILKTDDDSPCYIATAQYIQDHGHLPTEMGWLYRVFPGLPLLMVALNQLVGNVVISGYILIFFCGLGSLFLIQHWFDKFRLTIIAGVFLPYTISTTSHILSEGPSMFCMLLGAWSVVRLRDRPVLLYACILIAGYGLVIRHPEALLTMPLIFILAWKLPKGSLCHAFLLCAIASVPMAIYLTWSWLTIHTVVPQYKYEQFGDCSFAQTDPGHVSARVINFPFFSLWEGLSTPGQSLGKKIDVLGSVLVTVAALARLFFIYTKGRTTRDGILALAFGSALFCYTLLHVSLGFSVGFKWLDRYLCSANPMIDWGLFYHRPLRWVWIIFLIVAGTVFASLSGYGPNHVGFIR